MARGRNKGVKERVNGSNKEVRKEEQGSKGMGKSRNKEVN
jgi:hypothetical protein